MCRSWTNKQILACWTAADEDMDKMSASCSLVKAELDRGHASYKLRAKFDLLSKQMERGTLKADAGVHDRHVFFFMARSVDRHYKLPGA